MAVQTHKPRRPIPPRGPRGRPTGTKYRAYRVFLTLLYGQFDWIVRGLDGRTRVTVSRCATHFSCRPPDLQWAMAQAELWGFVHHLKWSHGWFEFVPAVPPGMAINISIQTITNDHTPVRLGDFTHDE